MIWTLELISLTITYDSVSIYLLPDASQFHTLLVFLQEGGISCLVRVAAVDLDKVMENRGSVTLFLSYHRHLSV